VEARRKGGWIEPASHTGGYFGSSAGWPMGTSGTAPADMTRATGIRYSWYSRYWQLATFEPHRRLSRGSSASSAYCRHEPVCRAGAAARDGTPQQRCGQLAYGTTTSTRCWRREHCVLEAGSGLQNNTAATDGTRQKRGELLAHGTSSNSMSRCWRLPWLYIHCSAFSPPDPESGAAGARRAALARRDHLANAL
jgi:hypothetical protein